jgi:serine/threonine protein phosphatase PrpC
MDNPFTRERLELLVNQMTLKQNGGNTLFLRNYENGPSYAKEITIITKDNTQTLKKNIKINECTKAGCSGPGIVKTNQDAYFVKDNFLKNPDYFFIGVCDGHGEQGQLVSNYVANKLPTYITDLSNENIINAFKKVNKEIYANSKMDSNMSGTTVVSIIMTPNNIICVNLGDSRAALFKYDSGIYYCKNLSRDHKPCEADETKRIINSGGRVKKCYDEDHKRFIGPDRVWMKNREEPGLAMTRSLGDKIAHDIGVIDEPEFKTFTYDGSEKFIIIASDGLWEYVSGDQCISIVKPFYEEGLDSKEAAFALTKEAFRRWKRKEVAIDDITVVVIFFD